jgi:hypothetical protein
VITIEFSKYQNSGGYMAIAVGSNTLKKEDNKAIALQIAAILQDIRFGSVEVVVHDGRVVQIDKRERFRVNEQKATA